jgi:predicted AAA+ superfamily ATPase
MDSTGEINSASIEPKRQTTLTPSQEEIVTTSLRLLPEFKILVIKGETSSGKYITALELFRRANVVIREFDLCELAKDMKHELSNQDLVAYFDELVDEVQTLMSFGENRGRRGIIYIRHYNRVIDVLSDCNSKLRFFFPLILKKLVESMPPNIHIVMTTQGCMLSEGMHWCLDLNTTRQDMEHFLQSYVADGTISVSESEQILKISKTIPVGRIAYCLRYALAIARHDNMTENDFIIAYRKALSRFSGSTVDVDKDIPNPVPEDDLIGVESIIDEITTSIINPMQLRIPGIPLKKGLLLAGPPGTGKTSIGRWLAHKIKGKFYLIDGQDGVSGPTLIERFCNTIRRARENAPAVVFIDDADVLFDHDDTYRAFLTVLDGIESSKRSEVCVVVTCMDMRRVPSSLLRGGRLEMALVTRLPDQDKIRIILKRSLDKIMNILREIKFEGVESIAASADEKFILDLSHLMTGWNCADIHRCVNDVLRLMIAGKGINLNTHFKRCIKQITDQYKLCGRCESTNLDYNPQHAYIG